LAGQLHPYTQLLKESVPSPAARETWAQRIGLSTKEVKEYNRVGYKFAARHHMAAEVCIKDDPPEIEEDDRIVMSSTRA
jgi:peptide/nickel transport system ATP-binding protein